MGAASHKIVFAGRAAWRSGGQVRVFLSQEESMTWNTPKLVEIALGAEINSYACADVK